MDHCLTDDATWETLCEDSQYRHDLGADWIPDIGELVLGGGWLTRSGITNAEQVGVTAAPDVIRVQRREQGDLGLKSSNPGQLAGVG
ncbi:TPA: hypothetical protein JD344_24880 [Serratia marcescens]|nr:hypothetical protein AM681_13850 [Serratia marcescens]AVU40746.1 hypothetical protein AS658_13705 [Serratia marcescens]EGT3598282.1 hypothetical protein [Serratia marcescens]OSX82078.1 hypothetical protein B9L20_25280 [Serratia marcescens]TWY24651.1 hypothetical protein FR965_29420 [Serratia marcescens]